MSYISSVFSAFRDWTAFSRSNQGEVRWNGRALKRRGFLFSFYMLKETRKPSPNSYPGTKAFSFHFNVIHALNVDIQSNRNHSEFGLVHWYVTEVKIFWGRIFEDIGWNARDLFDIDFSDLTMDLYYRGGHSYSPTESHYFFRDLPWASMSTF